MAGLGFLAAMSVARFNAKHSGLDDNKAVDLTLCALVAGIVGARVFYVIEFWEAAGFSRHWLSIFRVDQGGIVFYGGFIAAVATFFVFSRMRKFSFLMALDLFAPTIAVAHVFGRIGCFLNGCCYGKACELPWRFTYPVEGYSLLPALRGVALHPVQLYEALGNVAVCLITMALLRRRHKVGAVAGLYLLLYGALRFCDEFFRGDHVDFDPFLHFFTPAQVLCLLVIIPAGLFFLLRKEQRHEGELNTTGAKTDV